MNIKEYLNKRFGKLLIIGLEKKVQRIRNGKKDGHFYYFKCLCDCGKETIVLKEHLKSGHTTSCGCEWKRTIQKINNKYKVYPEIYNSWHSMICRCTNPKNPRWDRYGGRGIKVCDEWLNSSESFINWSIINGWKKGLSIDRIDNDGNYEPNNCRWVSNYIQSRNTSRNVWVNYKEKKMILKDACLSVGINQDNVSGYAKKHNLNIQESFDRYTKQFYDRSLNIWVDK